MKKEELNIYVSPKAKTVEIKAQAIICASPEPAFVLQSDTGYTEEEW